MLPAPEYLFSRPFTVAVPWSNLTGSGAEEKSYAGCKSLDWFTSSSLSLLALAFFSPTCPLSYYIAQTAFPAARYRFAAAADMQMHSSVLSLRSYAWRILAEVKMDSCTTFHACSNHDPRYCLDSAPIHLRWRAVVQRLSRVDCRLDRA